MGNLCASGPTGQERGRVVVSQTLDLDGRRTMIDIEGLRSHPNFKQSSIIFE